MDNYQPIKELYEDYKVIQMADEKPDKFNKEVKSYLDKGWDLYGELKVLPTLAQNHLGQQKSMCTYVQAVVLPDLSLIKKQE